MTNDKEDEGIYKETIGTEINWNEGKNVTIKITKKKKKNKSILFILNNFILRIQSCS